VLPLPPKWQAMRGRGQAGPGCAAGGSAGRRPGRGGGGGEGGRHKKRPPCCSALLPRRRWPSELSRWTTTVWAQLSAVPLYRRPSFAGL